MPFIRSPRVDCKTRAALGAYSAERNADSVKTSGAGRAGIDAYSLETRATLGRGQRSIKRLHAGELETNILPFSQAKLPVEQGAGNYRVNECGSYTCE